VSVLAGRRAGRSRERARLEVRDPHLAVLDAPGGLVGIDPQPQHAGAQLVPRGRALGRRPVRQVVRDPPAGVQCAAAEVLVELEVEGRAVEHPHMLSARAGAMIA
jgi:hypothetical protein